MGHSAELLEAILSQVRRSYPETKGFNYIMEKRLLMPAKNIQPDIQVVRPDGSVVCVVEIGYTRPEKLRLYKELGIPDIRWVDKGGKPVNPLTVTKRVERVVVSKPATAEIWRYVRLPDGETCDNCFQEYMDAAQEEAGENSEEAADLIERFSCGPLASGEGVLRCATHAD